MSVLRSFPARRKIFKVCNGLFRSLVECWSVSSRFFSVLSRLLGLGRVQKLRWVEIVWVTARGFERLRVKGLEG